MRKDEASEANPTKPIKEEQGESQKQRQHDKNEIDSVAEDSFSFSKTYFPAYSDKKEINRLAATEYADAQFYEREINREQPLIDFCNAPFSCIGVLYFTDGEQIKIGTGTLIGPNVVLTSAKNLYEWNIDNSKRSQYHQLCFKVKCNGEVCGGSSKVKRYFYPREFEYAKNESEAQQYDYGIVILEKYLGDEFGYMGLSDKPFTSSLDYHLYGYTSEVVQSKRSTVLRGTSGKDISLEEFDILRYNKDYLGNESGSALYFKDDEDLKIFGIDVNSNFEKGRLSRGLFLNKERLKEISNWILESLTPEDIKRILPVSQFINDGLEKDSLVNINFLGLKNTTQEFLLMNSVESNIGYCATATAKMLSDLSFGLDSSGITEISGIQKTIDILTEESKKLKFHFLEKKKEEIVLYENMKKIAEDLGIERNTTSEMLTNFSTMLVDFNFSKVEDIYSRLYDLMKTYHRLSENQKQNFKELQRLKNILECATSIGVVKIHKDFKLPCDITTEQNNLIEQLRLEVNKLITEKDEQTNLIKNLSVQVSDSNNKNATLLEEIEKLKKDAENDMNRVLALKCLEEEKAKTVVDDLKKQLQDFDDLNKRLHGIEEEKKLLINDNQKLNNDLASVQEDFSKWRQNNEIELKLDSWIKHKDLVLSNNDNTVCQPCTVGHRSVLGNVGMTKGVYTWDIFIDNLKNNHWIGIGVCVKSELTKDLTSDYNKSFMITSNNGHYRTTGTLPVLLEGQIYNCKLDLDDWLFSITGNGVDVKNDKPLPKNEPIYVILHLCYQGNQLTIKNFRKIK